MEAIEMKAWQKIALGWLEESLYPIPKELNEIDWKESLSPNNEKLAQHLSAFANQLGGGYLVFGVKNQGEIKGVNPQEVKDIVEKLANIGRDSLSPAVSLDYVVTTYCDKPILLIHIAEAKSKPVHLSSGTIENSYIRSGGSTRIVSRQELAVLMLNSRPLVWEELQASGLLTSGEVLKKLNYQKILELLKRPISQNEEEIVSWMEKEGMIKRQFNDHFIITNFGAISAANNLEEFDSLRRKAIRIIRYKGNNKVDTIEEISGHKGYAVGFEGLINYLRNLLPRSEIIQAIRQEAIVYPEIALRELIANALIHQDFTITGTGPMVEIFDNRIEIRNPGRLLSSKKIDRLIGTNPESRNEFLASSFRRFYICEERGTGFIKAVDAVEMYGLPPLGFEEGTNYFKVTIFSPKSFADMSDDERISACYQHAVIKHLSSSAMTNTSLRQRLKMSERQRPQVSKLIKEALAKEVIKQKDPNNKSTKFAEYVPYWA